MDAGHLFQAEEGDGVQQETDAGEAEGGGGEVDAGGNGSATEPREGRVNVMGIPRRLAEI